MFEHRCCGQGREQCLRIFCIFWQGHVQPLPCDTSNVSAVFDLHAAHTTTYDQEASEVFFKTTITILEVTVETLN